MREDERLDALFARTRAEFDLPEGVVYLDGNSLGPPTRAALAAARRAAEVEWAQGLIRSWNDAGWIDLAGRAASKIERIVGAEPGSVEVCDATSINLFKVLSAALALRPGRRVLLTDDRNFPSDLYVATGLAESLPAIEVEIAPADRLEEFLSEDVAALFLTQVDYRSGAKRDIAEWTERAHSAGALAIWDLAHSAGAFEISIEGVDFAVGCGYKFLNGGPGAPGFVYAAPRHGDALRPALRGWLGHADPFAFEPRYRPASGARRLTVGTPPILSLRALDAALDLFDGIEMADVEAGCARLIDAFDEVIARRAPALERLTPQRHGSQLAYRFEAAYPLIRRLIDLGVIGDFRAPDVARFGFSPLFLDRAQVVRAAEAIAEAVARGEWRGEQGRARAKVT